MKNEVPANSNSRLQTALLGIIILLLVTGLTVSGLFWRRYSTDREMLVKIEQSTLGLGLEISKLEMKFERWSVHPQHVSLQPREAIPSISSPPRSSIQTLPKYGGPAKSMTLEALDKMKQRTLDKMKQRIDIESDRLNGECIKSSVHRPTLIGFSGKISELLRNYDRERSTLGVDNKRMDAKKIARMEAYLSIAEDFLKQIQEFCK